MSNELPLILTYLVYTWFGFEQLGLLHVQVKDSTAVSQIDQTIINDRSDKSILESALPGQGIWTEENVRDSHWTESAHEKMYNGII